MKGCTTYSRVDVPSRHVSDIPLKWLLLKWSRNVEAVWNVARPVQTVPSLSFHLVERSRNGSVHICTVLLESRSIGVISIKKTAHVDPLGHMAWLSLVLVLCGTWAVHFHRGGGDVLGCGVEDAVLWVWLSQLLHCSWRHTYQRVFCKRVRQLRTHGRTCSPSHSRLTSWSETPVCAYLSYTCCRLLGGAT